MFRRYHSSSAGGTTYAYNKWYLSFFLGDGLLCWLGWIEFQSNQHNRQWIFLTFWISQLQQRTCSVPSTKFQIRWLDLALNRAYSQLSKNNSEMQNLSLINNAISQSIDQHSVSNASYKPLTCSVPWAQFCLSDIQRSSENIINTRRYWTVQYFAKYFTFFETFF